MVGIRVAQSLPGDLPVAEGGVLAYSCAAARDLHPLPCLRRAAKTRVPKEMAKNENNLNESKGAAEGSQIECRSGVSFQIRAGFGKFWRSQRPFSATLAARSP